MADDDQQTGSCIRFNQSDPFKIGNNYGGIPVNLVTNLIGWAILLILFFLIRKSTIRNVGRRVAKTTLDGVDSAVTTWTHIFFGGENTPAATKGGELSFKKFEFYNDAYLSTGYL
jgi:hypothetical protein